MHVCEVIPYRANKNKTNSKILFGLLSIVALWEQTSLTVSVFVSWLRSKLQEAWPSALYIITTDHKVLHVSREQKYLMNVDVWMCRYKVLFIVVAENSKHSCGAKIAAEKTVTTSLIISHITVQQCLSHFEKRGLKQRDSSSVTHVAASLRPQQIKGGDTDKAKNQFVLSVKLMKPGKQNLENHEVWVNQ